MDALENVLSIPSVRAEHPRLHADAVAQLAFLRGQAAAHYDEVKRLREQAKRHELVLKMYANKDNWKSINGVMVLQTLSHPWADAEYALKGGGNA